MQNNTLPVLRRGTPSDAVALARLEAETFAETFADQNTPEDMTKHLAQHFGETQQHAELSDPNVGIVLAFAEDELVGFAHVERKAAPPCITNPNATTLNRFYILKTWHGRGIAKALLEAAVGAAREQNATQLWLTVWEHNPRAIAFYNKVGFVKAGVTEFVLGDDVQTDWVMTLEL